MGVLGFQKVESPVFVLLWYFTIRYQIVKLSVEARLGGSSDDPTRKLHAQS